MKTHHYIFISTFAFILLFYNEKIGLNLGLLSLLYSIFLYIKTSKKNRNISFKLFFIASILASFAFAWFGDISSFLALVFSVLQLSFRSKNRRLKILFLIPVLVTNFLTFFCRFFDFKDWFPKSNNKNIGKKFLAFIFIPLIFVLVFFLVYQSGSHYFAQFFSGFTFNLSVWQIICLGVLGFFLAFNLFNFVVEKQIYQQNHILENEFIQSNFSLKPSFSFLDLDFERMSGVISLFCLNVLLIFFIISYNYEQFYEVVKSPNQLSQETHERVNTVIISIVLAILVIMFYFKSSFNFDSKAGLLKWAAKIWLILNAILVVSAMLKNTEYIVNYGFTYKRLGVYAFLVLCLIGLLMSFIKIQRKKTNAFLFNSMVGFVYGMILVCSFINWGGFITSQNMKRNDFHFNFHLKNIWFSEKELLKYAEKKNDAELKNTVMKSVKDKQSSTFLSKIMYYETINNK